MKKKILIIIIILFIISLIPIPFKLKDGGTTIYNAILYTIEDVHRINPEIESDKPYIEGTIIKILGFEIYNNVK